MVDEAHAEVAPGEEQNVQQIPDPPPMIAIIGYGCAGITAAWRLLEEGYRVHIFEALNRRGGRAHTETPFGADVPIDLGCQWQHGDEWAIGIANHLPGDPPPLPLAQRLVHAPQNIRHHYAHPRNVVWSAEVDMEALQEPEWIPSNMWRVTEGEAAEDEADDDISAADAIAAVGEVLEAAFPDDLDVHLDTGITDVFFHDQGGAGKMGRRRRQ